jgi:hypothetical protein
VNPLPLPVRLTLVPAVTVAVGGVIATERLDARGRLFQRTRQYADRAKHKGHVYTHGRPPLENAELPPIVIRPSVRSHRLGARRTTSNGNTNVP